MTSQQQYEELARQLGVIGSVRRELGRSLPPELSPATAVVLALLRHHGELRMGRIAELLDVDVSVASRHLTYLAEHGWIDRRCDPEDKRSRLLRLLPEGERLLAEVSRRYAGRLAVSLREWSEEDVLLLISLLVRLRDSFGIPHPHPQAYSHAAPPADTHPQAQAHSHAEPHPRAEPHPQARQPEEAAGSTAT